MLPPYSRLVVISVACISSVCFSQTPQNDRIQVAPPLLQIQAPPKDASPDDLEKQGDLLRARKEYLDAVDYYRAAIAKQSSASVLNKLGIAELMLERYRDAGRDFERALKMDRKFAEPYNNLGVVDYKRRKYGSAIKLYKKSIALVPDSASFYSNLGAAYFAKKEFEQASQAYPGLENLQFFLDSTETQASPSGLTHIEPNGPPAARPEHAPSSAVGMGLLFATVRRTFSSLSGAVCCATDILMSLVESLLASRDIAS